LPDSTSDVAVVLVSVSGLSADDRVEVDCQSFGVGHVPLEPLETVLSDMAAAGAEAFLLLGAQLREFGVFVCECIQLQRELDLLTLQFLH